MVELHRIDAPEDRDLTDHLDLLDAGERARMDRFAQQADRRRYAAAHVGLRTLLGRRLGLPARKVRLGRAPCPLCGADHGCPISLDDPEGTSFSIAHSEGLVLLAVADGALGVDVEPIAAAEHRADLDIVLHPEERAAVERLPDGERPRAVLSCWVRTEAHLKALGTGLGLDPATVAVGPAAPGTVARLDGWCVVDLDVGPGHVAALSVAERLQDRVMEPPRSVEPLELP